MKTTIDVAALKGDRSNAAASVTVRLAYDGTRCTAGQGLPSAHDGFRRDRHEQNAHHTDTVCDGR